MTPTAFPHPRGRFLRLGGAATALAVLLAVTGVPPTA
ncbi:hypothetical protein A8924_2731 [Saccharopolyspora erythraea NRRL 2338]|nr:hypothetical protein A8924_2731 [Saccharopolyspora erythraea NRRL 2338]